MAEIEESTTNSKQPESPQHDSERERSPKSPKSRSQSPARSPRSRSKSPRSRSGSRSRYRRSERGEKSERRRSPAGRRGSRDKPEAAPCRVLGIFGLHQKTTKDDLKTEFSKYGEIESCTVIIDKKTGQSKRYGFIYFETTEGAVKARDKMKGVEFQGREIRVDFSTTTKPHESTPGRYMGKVTRSTRYPPRYSSRYHPYRDYDYYYRRSPPRSPPRYHYDYRRYEDERYRRSYDRYERDRYERERDRYERDRYARDRYGDRYEDERYYRR